MSAGSDARYGRQGGRFVPTGDGRTIAEIRADHLATAPSTCRCLWHAEGTDDDPQLGLFGEEP